MFHTSCNSYCIRSILNQFTTIFFISAEIKMMMGYKIFFFRSVVRCFLCKWLPQISNMQLYKEKRREERYAMETFFSSLSPFSFPLDRSFLLRKARLKFQCIWWVTTFLVIKQCTTESLLLSIRLHLVKSLTIYFTYLRYIYKVWFILRFLN